MAGETTPLRSGTALGSTSSKKQTGARCSIITLVLLSAALIALTITFQLKLRSLSTQLSTEKSHLSSLQTKVDDQQSVIDRFSSAVSNKDVLAKVDALEDELQNTQKELMHQLTATERSIEDMLNATITKLDTTVKLAQDEIQMEVDKVKHDVNDYVIQTQDQFSAENSFMIFQLAGTFTLLASLISMWHMTAHLRRFNQPFVQRKILAILWMSPVYGVTSWLSLVLPLYDGYFAVIKDFYEAYVIYQFMSFLIAVLGKGDREAVVDLLAQHADHLKPPFRLFGCCLPNPYESPRAMADAVLLQCQSFTMQFVFFRPLTTIGIFLCNKFNYYGWGDSVTDYRSFQFWLVMIQNLSVFTAFSGLLKFYHAVDEDLAWCRPFPKFLCIKGIVFLTFWQGLAIAILAASIGESTPNVGSDDAELWAKQAQNFLICLEMLLFSIAHFYCFPTEEWEDGYRPVVSDAKFGDQLALHDFFQDIKLLARQGKKKNDGKKKSKSDYDDDGNEINDMKKPDGDPDSDGATAKEVASDGGIAVDDSFDEDDLNLSQVESQIEGNLASPDTPENIRAASIRLLQAMAFETPIVHRNATGTQARSSPRVDDSSQTAEDLLPSSSQSPPVATAEIADVDEEDHHQSQQYQEQAPDEENNSNTMTLRYDDEAGEVTGLLGSSSDRSRSDGAGDDNVMGGPPSDGDSMLRPSLFTTLGKFE